MSLTIKSGRWVWAAAALMALWPLGALADEGDPPTRVARIGYTEGSVSFQPAGVQDWVDAPLNRPLTTGDTLWLDQNSRTELQLDGSIIRLSGSTELSFVNLSNDVTQLQLASGTLVLHVRRLDGNENYEVDTPNLAFSVLRPGVYRISVDGSGNTWVSVRSGEGEVTGGGSAYSLRTGDAEVFSGSDALSANGQPQGGVQDDFDAWCAGRDARWNRSESARYVSPDVVGYEDLDGQGTWQPSPEYGPVWYPSQVAVGWAPYHAGHWSYIAPWGYTWVDDQPWGFAPFHYGRWVWIGGAWGWIPSPPRAVVGPYIRPVYSPALVAWVGAGAGVAWFALGPREVYIPSYPVSANYVRNINISNTTVNTTTVTNVYNTTIINNKTVNVTYVNRAVPGAIAATSTQAFSTAQPVGRNRLEMDQRTLANAPARPFAPAVVPTRQAVLGSTRLTDVKPPESVLTRAIVARTAPPPPPPAFDRRQEAIKENGGRPLSVTQVRQIQPAAAVQSRLVQVAPPAAPVNVVRPAVRPAAPREVQISQPVPAAVHPKDLPPVARPVSPNVANTVLERQQLQQQEQLRAQQDQERRSIEQQQEREHAQTMRQQQDDARQQALQHQQLAKQQADQGRQQEIERQHQQQTQQLQQKQIQEQQQMQQRQIQEQQQIQQRQQSLQNPPPQPNQPKQQNPARSAKPTPPGRTP